MGTVASPLRLFFELASRGSGQREALSWHPAPPRPVVRWTYRRLWFAAVDGAKLLVSSGAVPSAASASRGQNAIAVAVEEGVELVVAFLAIALAGAVIVPISAKEPPARIASILADANCVAVIVDSRNNADGHTSRVEEAVKLASLSHVTTRIEAADLVPLNDDSVACADRNLQDSAVGLQLDDDDDDDDANQKISHVVFTSGSTGRPKGCVCTRQALSWYCFGKNESHRVDSGSTVFIASPHTFDPCLGDIFATLGAGAKIALAPKRNVFANLVTCLVETSATHLLTTPTMLGTVPVSEIQSVQTHLKVVALGGEPMSLALAKNWVRHIDTFANTFGVTECCVYQTFCKIHRDDVTESSIRRVGTPLSRQGVRLFVTSPEDTTGVYLKEFFVGDDDDHFVGTDLLALWIAGTQVGSGYLNDLRATDTSVTDTGDTEESTKVQSSSFHKLVLDESGNETAVYRTGDLVRRGARAGGGGGDTTNKSSSYLEFFGRQDRCQVKLNGARVDLREIELAVCGSGFVSACVCVVTKSTLTDSTKSTESTNAPDVLTTHVTLHPGELFDAASRVALEVFAACLLPPNFVPKRFVRWDKFPSTSTGKVDLKEMERKGHETSCDSRASDVSTQETQNKLTPNELAVANAWSEALGLSTSNGISADDDFFAVGGNSVSALRATRCLERRAQSGGRGNENPRDETGEGDTETVGLEKGEAAAFFRDDEKSACAFDSLNGFLSPLELLTRPSLRKYAAFLQESGYFGEFSDDGDHQIADLHLKQPELATSKARDAAADEKETRITAALVTACATGRVGLVKCLLQCGADPNHTARDGFTPLHVAASCESEKNGVGVLKALLRAGADPRAVTAAGTTAAHLAAARGAADSLTLLLIHGCPVDTTDGDKQSVTHLAARSGGYLVTEIAATACAPLRNKAGAGLEKKDAWRRTAADWALLTGNCCALLALVDSGARITKLSHAIARSCVVGFESGGGVTDSPNEVVRVPNGGSSQNPSDKKTTKTASVISRLVDALLSRDDLPENEGVVLKQETLESALAFLQAVTTLKELVCGNGDNRNAAVRLGAVAPLVRAVVDSLPTLRREELVVSLRGDALPRDSVHQFTNSVTLQIACASCGALRNLAYANPVNREAVRLAGAVDALEVVLSILDKDATAPDGTRKQLAFVANSALVNLKRNE